MDHSGISTAATLLAEARRSGRPLAALPDGAQPADFAEAQAIQDATVALLGDAVVGYKVAGRTPETSTWGAVLRSRCFPSPATVATGGAPCVGVEGEIAFHLDRDIGPDERAFTPESFDAAVTAVATIEIVDTRFASYADTPLLHRTADMMSNGGLVHAGLRADWRSVALDRVPVTMTRNGAVIVEQIGGHAAGDPRIPALAFLNAPHRPDRVPRGTILTTGTCTGLQPAGVTDRIEVRFDGFEAVTLTFTA